MERFQKLELIQRSLGLRHKLKVHESMKAPETHEDLALMLLAKWELEDELRAVEELLAQNRIANVAHKKATYEKELKDAGPDKPVTPTGKKKAKKNA